MMESQKIHHTVPPTAGLGTGATPAAWGILKSPSPFFLPLEGGGPEVGVKFSPLTPTLSHGGERENKVESDYIMPASRNGSKRLLRGYQ